MATKKTLTIDDWRALFESYACAQGIAIAQAVELVAPGKAEAFAQALQELAPRVGASDAVAAEMLRQTAIGASAFVRNESPAPDALRTIPPRSH